MNQSMLFNDIIPITTDYAFCKVMEDNPEICRKLVELILMDDLGEIELVVQKQKTIDTTPDGRGVRLDVYAKTPDFVCNIEMQTTDERNHGKRARYYQSLIDADLLDKGQRFENGCGDLVCLCDRSDMPERR
ncbi:MAG: PD-(D/E)XK nuclease family transposase [Firmicutes bacterium]|nr:PD-(D/E)XK nuclease family transposase [Bacillota bacterium]